MFENTPFEKIDPVRFAELVEAVYDALCPKILAAQQNKKQESDSTLSIYPAFIAAQHEIEPVKKNATNDYIGSTYADLKAVIDSLKPVLKKHNLGFTQKAEPSTGQEARLTTRIIHVSGEWFESTITVPAVHNHKGNITFDAQTYGAAMTYARRYALAAMFGLAQEDTDGQMHAVDDLDQGCGLDEENIDTSAGANEQKLRGAKNLQALLKVMNDLSAEEQKPLRGLFQELLAGFNQKKAPRKSPAKKVAK